MQTIQQVVVVRSKYLQIYGHHLGSQKFGPLFIDHQSIIDDTVQKSKTFVNIKIENISSGRDFDSIANIWISLQ